MMEITKPATISKHSSSTTLQQACSVLRLINQLNLVSGAFITHAKKYNIFESKHCFLAKRPNKRHEDAFSNEEEVVKCMRRTRVDFR